MPSFYMEKVVPEKNMKRFYFISNDRQICLFGYPVTIIFGRIGESARCITKIFPNESKAHKYFDKQLHLRQSHNYALVDPPFERTKSADRLQLGLPLF